MLGQKLMVVLVYCHRAGAPFLMGSALMVVAVVVAATLPTRSGGAVLAPLLESDDEADVEAAACSTHFSDLPTPTVVRPPHHVLCSFCTLTLSGSLRAPPAVSTLTLCCTINDLCQQGDQTSRYDVSALLKSAHLRTRAFCLHFRLLYNLLRCLNTRKLHRIMMPCIDDTAVETAAWQVDAVGVVGCRCLVMLWTRT